MDAYQQTFCEYLREQSYEGITESEKRYLLEYYLESIENAIQAGKEISEKVLRKISSLKKAFNNGAFDGKIKKDDVLRVDDIVIVKSKNGDFEGSFRGWYLGRAIVWAGSHGQLSVDKNDVYKK